MDISSQNKAALNLLTASEVAMLLKMNTQVITRKLSSGELEGYKIGKEWRVSEEQVLHFLEKKKNNSEKKSKSERVVETFFNKGRLKEIPSSRSKRTIVLKHLVSMLDEEKIYSEKEINSFIKEFHEDACTIRREFIGNKLMVRKDGKYKRVRWNP